MATKLTDMKISEVSFVPKGANPLAKIALFKSETAPIDELVSLIQKADAQTFIEVVQRDERWKKYWEKSDELSEKFWSLKDSMYTIMDDKDKTPEEKSIIYQDSISQFLTYVSMSLLDMKSIVAKAERSIKSEIISGKSVQFSAGDYAYTPDKSKPSTWKLRLTNIPGGKPDVNVVAAAVAALGKGFRGNRVQLPSSDRPAVIRRVRQAWLKAHPDKSRDDLPDILKAADGGMTKTKQEASMPKLLDPTAIEDLIGKAIEDAGKDADMASVVSKALSVVIGKANEVHDGVNKELEDTKAKLAKSGDESFTDADGNKVTKSDMGEAAFKMLKSMNDRIVAQAHDAAIAKASDEADSKYPNVPLEKSDKGALAVAMKSLPEGVQKSIETLLVQSNKLTDGFVRKADGHNVEDNAGDSDVDRIVKALEADGTIPASK